MTTAVAGAAALAAAPWLRLNAADSLAAAPGYFQCEFGITDELCRKVLARALAKGGDFADLYFEHTISNWVGLEDGKVNRAYGDVALGVGIRTVKGDQVGYGFTQELTEASMLAAAAIAATIADSAPGRPAGQFAALALAERYPLPRLFSSVSLDAKVPLVQAVNDRCFALSPLVVKVNASFHDQQKRILIVTSDGAKAEDLPGLIGPFKILVVRGKQVTSETIQAQRRKRRGN